MDLKNMVVVITGAGKGLGKALALRFTKEGARVIASSRTESDLQELTKKTLGKHFVADVTSEKQLRSLADFAIEKLGKIDIWINNAGITVPHAPFEKMDPKRIHEIFEVNFFWDVFWMSRCN